MKLPLKDKPKKKFEKFEEAPAPKRRKKRKKISLPKININLSFLSKISARAVLYILFAVIVLSAVGIVFITSLPEKDDGGKYDPDLGFYKDESDDDENIDIAVGNYEYSYYKFESSSLVDYKGDVEFISFNPIIAYPSLAFDGDQNAKELDERSLTAKEFLAVLQALYDKGYIIINMNDIMEETTASDGSLRLQKKTLSLPKSRKPVVLIFEDVNYYDRYSGDGYADKLTLAQNGEVWSSSTNENGNTVLSPDLDAITLLDKFVKENPEFSFNGAKGCIALTGSEGVFGYNTQSSNTDEKDRKAEIAYAKAIASQLKKTGWYFACHTYDHIDIANCDFTTVVSDMTKWVNEVGSIVGSTKILIYPESSTRELVNVLQEGETFDYLLDLGFKLFSAVRDSSSVESLSGSAAIVCGHMSLDGFDLRWSRNKLLNILDVAAIYDGTVRVNYGNNYVIADPAQG